MVWEIFLVRHWPGPDGASLGMCDINSKICELLRCDYVLHSYDEASIYTYLMSVGQIVKPNY